MIGRRHDCEPFPEMECGDYGLYRGKWYCRTPNGLHGALGLHNVIEHADGTITVEPSIEVRTHDNRYWHGFLEHGEWRSV